MPDLFTINAPTAGVLLAVLYAPAVLPVVCLGARRAVRAWRRWAQ